MVIHQKYRAIIQQKLSNYSKEMQKLLTRNEEIIQQKFRNYPTELKKLSYRNEEIVHQK